jgi:hypothetical protein
MTCLILEGDLETGHSAHATESIWELEAAPTWRGNEKSLLFFQADLLGDLSSGMSACAFKDNPRDNYLIDGLLRAVSDNHAHPIASTLGLPDSDLVGLSATFQALLFGFRILASVPLVRDLQPTENTSSGRHDQNQPLAERVLMPAPPRALVWLGVLLWPGHLADDMKRPGWTDSGRSWVDGDQLASAGSLADEGLFAPMPVHAF